jgi:hypothetical protein
MQNYNKEKQAANAKETKPFRQDNSPTQNLKLNP